jgi:hypothetical protein
VARLAAIIASREDRAMRLFTVTVEGQQPDVVEAVESAEAACRALASMDTSSSVSIDVTLVSRLS